MLFSSTVNLKEHLAKQNADFNCGPEPVFNTSDRWEIWDGILGHQFDSNILLHAIHSSSTGGFYKKPYSTLVLKILTRIRETSTKKGRGLQLELRETLDLCLTNHVAYFHSMDNEWYVGCHLLQIHFYAYWLSLLLMYWFVPLRNQTYNPFLPHKKHCNLWAGMMKSSISLCCVSDLFLVSFCFTLFLLISPTWTVFILHCKKVF